MAADEKDSRPKGKRPPLEGRYEILDRVGKGGMGVVFRALDLEAGGPVAIKFLQPRHAGDVKQVKRFLREAKMLEALDHPHVVKIHRFGVYRKTHYIVMDFLEGRTLSSYLEEGHEFPIEEAVEIVGHLASGLAYAHGQGIIHRDIKPSNIVIEPDGRPVLTDFGLARRAQDEGVTQTGAVLGTAQYMSPEQARGEEAIGERSDVFSLGVVFYEMVTGVSPFEGGSLFNILKKVVEYVPPSPRQLKSSVPAAIDSIVSRCMVKRPEARMASMTELVMDLEAYLTGEYEAPPDAGGDEGGADLPVLEAYEGEDEERPARRPGRRPSGRERRSSRRTSSFDPSSLPRGTIAMCLMDGASVMLLFAIVVESSQQGGNSEALPCMACALVVLGPLFLGLDIAILASSSKRKFVEIRRVLLLPQFLLFFMSILGALAIVYINAGLKKYLDDLQHHERVDRRRRLVRR